MLNIPIPLYWKTELSVALGGHLHPCSECGQLQPHLLQQVIQRDTIFFAFKHDTPIHKISQCEVCDSLSRHSQRDLITHTSRWCATDDIHQFAQEVGPVSLDSDYSPITPDSLHAMLRSIASTPLPEQHVSLLDYLFILLSTIAFAGVFLILGLLLKISDSTLTLGLLFSLFIGLLVGMLVFVHPKKKGLVQDRRHHLLLERLDKLQISPLQIRVKVPQKARIDERISELLRSLP